MSIEPTQAISTVTAEKVGLAIAAPARPSIVSVHAGTGELLRITPTGEVIAPSLEAASEAGRVFVDSIRHHLQPSTPASGEVVAWMYRWKVDGEYVNWRYSDASNYHKSLDGYEETPLYKHAAPAHPAADLVEALRKAESAIAEYYRYWTGGETRGSYDGKPERQGLWEAQRDARAALSRYAGGA